MSIRNRQPKEEPVSDTVSREEFDLSMGAIQTDLIQLANTPPPKITSTTKRMVVIGIMTAGIIVSVGWASGTIEAVNALIILNGILNGGFALIKT